jgi:hypothetical protein
MTSSACRFVVPHALLWLSLATVSAAGAQQRPLTGQMLGEPSAPATTPAAAPVARPAPVPFAAPAPVALALPAHAQIGDTTRALLQLQASGERAGGHLPILGDQASASYARYLDSFKHPIPEYLEKSVRKDVSGSGSGE